MKSDAITKSYSALSNKQRAALFFQYTTQEDELETVRVVSSVPKKSYIMNDVEFLKWVDGFSDLAKTFAHEHWFARHGLVASVMRMKILILKNTEQMDLWEKTVGEVLYWRKNLIAIDTALSAVAKQHKFDLQCVYQRAKTVPYKANIDEIAVDTEMVDIWIHNFNLMVESSFG